MTGATETFADLAFSTQLIERQLKATRVALIGRVRESKRAYDLAFRNEDGRTVVVRCVTEPRAADHIALKTMLSEGDFDRAFLVHTGDETDLTGDIPTYPLSRIDELAALLAKESPP
ncbi:MAG: hypothetical protein HXY28_13950 [Hydrogenophilaceae bacterium]|jgi:hypothetical protein|nr:hypothetical protein [Hydrogenophilaceae bacterium]